MPTSTHHHQYHDQMIQHPPGMQQERGREQQWPTAAEFEAHMGMASSGTAQEETDNGQREEMEEPLPEVNWMDDAPADLASVLAVPPTIPEVLPLRSGATQETIPRRGDLSYSDQSALLMSDPSSSTSYRRKSVHFRESSGVPSSLEEALAQSTSIPGMSSSWEDPLVTDLSDFDEDAFMAFNGEKTIAQDGRIGVGDLEGWGEMQKDWDEFQQTLPQTGETRGADGRYLFQSRNPYASEGRKQDEGVGLEGRESPTIRVS
jgi:peroxin-5